MCEKWKASLLLYLASATGYANNMDIEWLLGPMVEIHAGGVVFNNFNNSLNGILCL